MPLIWTRSTEAQTFPDKKNIMITGLPPLHPGERVLLHETCQNDGETHFHHLSEMCTSQTEQISEPPL